MPMLKYTPWIDMLTQGSDVVLGVAKVVLLIDLNNAVQKLK